MNERDPDHGMVPGVQEMYERESYTSRAFPRQCLTEPPIDPYATLSRSLERLGVARNNREFRLCDLGTGDGLGLWQAMKLRWPQAYISGVDMRSTDWGLLKEYAMYTGIDPPELRQGTVENLPWQQPNNFDAVTSVYSAYYGNPDTWLRIVRRALKDDGLFGATVVVSGSEPLKTILKSTTAEILGIKPPPVWTDNFNADNAPSILYNHGFQPIDIIPEEAYITLRNEVDVQAYLSALCTPYSFYTEPQTSTHTGHTYSDQELKVYWAQVIEGSIAQIIFRVMDDSPDGTYRDPIKIMTFVSQKYETVGRDHPDR